MSTLHGLLNPWTDKELEKIHQASLTILEKTGVQVNHDRVLDILEATPAKVDRDKRIVRFPAEMVQDRLDNAPGSWDRQPSKSGEFIVSADCGCYSGWDYQTKLPRPGLIADLIDQPRLVEALPYIDQAGNLGYSPDIPVPLRDMIAYRHMWHHTQKQGGGSLGRCPSCCHSVSRRVFDYLYEMLEVKIGKEKMQTDPEFSFFMGVASPLRWGRDILKMTLHTIERGQVVGIGGNCACGIQSPITPAANIAVDHAERLSGLCIVTSIRHDAKFYFCNHTYFLDMLTGDIASGSAEQTLLALLGRKLLEHCGFHLVTIHPIMDTGTHCPDGQVAAEKMMYMLLTALGGAGGIGGAGQFKELFCYEQLVIDNEIAGYVKHLLKGAEITDQTIGLDDILELGPGGNFLTSDTTLKFMRDVYYEPQLFNRTRLSEWLRAGSQDILERAHEKVVEILTGETPTFLTEDQLAAIDNIIHRAAGELAPDWNPQPHLNV